MIIIVIVIIIMIMINITIMRGVLPPLGYFDPLGFTKDGDAAKSMINPLYHSN